MFVVMRKFPEDKEWNVCAVCASGESAIKEKQMQIKTGRMAVYYSANTVWIAENGNHTWK